MNTYLIPITDDSGVRIKKLVAASRKVAEEKLFNYFYSKFEELEGDTLEDIKEQLLDLGIEFGYIYDLEEFS